MRTSALAFFFIIYFFIFFISAALPQDRVISLKEALLISLAENPELRASREGYLAQREEIGIARSYLLPKILFEERFMRTDNPTYVFMARLNQERFEAKDFAIDSLNNPAPVNDFQTGLSFEQALFAPRAKIGIDMAKTGVSATENELERKKEDVAFRVFKTYLDVQTSKSFVRVSEQGIEDAKEHLRVAEARYNNSVGLYSDVLRAKVSLTSAEEKMISAKKNLELAKRALGLMLGLTEPLDAADERFDVEIGALDDHYRASLERKDIRSLEARYRNAENGLKMAGAGYLPMVGIGGSYQFNDHRVPFGTEGESWQLTAFLRWELFDGGKREHEREKARHSVSEAVESLEGFKKEVSFKVYEAYLGVEEAKKGLELATASVRSAEEAGRLVRVRYENSLSTIVELLDVQTSLDSARADAVSREAAVIASAVNLWYQSGTLMKNLGMEQ